MAVVPRKRKGKVVYGVLTSYGEGRTDWKLIGPNKRAAQEYDRACRKAVKAGTFKPDGELTDAASFRVYSMQWRNKRTNRAAENEWTFIRLHVLTRAWFAGKRMADFKPKHFIQLAKELTEQGRLSDKSISNTMGTLSVIFRDATIDEVLTVNPYVMPRGILKRSGEKRAPYTAEEAARLVEGAQGARQRIWNAIAFYTGARCGEVCGLRWRDWNRGPSPLSALTIERQYGGLVLKTERPRVVPVHPELERLLGEWLRVWPLHFLRRPSDDEPIVPGNGPLTDANRWPHMQRFTAYKAWRKGCDAAGVTNRSVHSSRHTFITLTLRGGADRRIVERITHNPKGDIVDVYTSHDWRQFCDAVRCLNLDAVLDAVSNGSSSKGSDSRTRTRLTYGKTWESGENEAIRESGFARSIARTDAVLDARLDFGPGWLGPLPPPERAADFALLQADLGGAAR